MILKKTIFLILTLFMLSWAVSPAFANQGFGVGEAAVPNSNGVEIVNMGRGAISNNGTIKAWRSNDLTQVESIRFFNQSTIVNQQVGAYYRTVAYEMALADANKNLITEYKDYNYNPYRQQYIDYMRQWIQDNGLPFGKPYASEEILYRKYLLQHFTPEQLDTAYYLSVQGVIEIYQVNANGTETVLSTITKENYKNYLPHGFEPLRKDIETRFVFVELNPPAPDFSLTTNQAVYQGDPGQIIDAWVTIHNTGNIAESTDIGSNWQGEGNNWATTQFSYSKESIGAIPAKSSRTPVRIPITIPDSAQTIWFKANIDGNTPTSEINQVNNFASAIVRPKPKNADVGVTITVSDTNPKEWRYVTATAKVTNYGPETADIYFEIGENNGSNQTISWADEYNITLAPGQSKYYSYDSESNEGGAVLYMAAKATVTNTTDPKLSNNFARTPKIVWQKYTPPVSEPSELESSLIH
jgi:hypothetical protein